MTDRSFERANDESRARLAALVDELTPARMTVDLGGGWTVATALGHMGFWDRWQAERLTRLLAGEWSADEESVVLAEDLANEALDPYWLGMDAGLAADLALAAATRIDGLIVSVPDSLVERIEATPGAYVLHRDRHRNDHLDQIARGLAAAEAARARRPAALDERAYLAANETSRSRLEALVAGLTPADLTRPVSPAEPAGWTVGQTLGHMAFWDRFLATRWRAAQAIGPGRAPAGMPPGLADLINGGLEPALAALSAGNGAGLLSEVISAARDVDGLIASLPPQAPIASVLAERPTLLDRSKHRAEHVGQIEDGLATG